MSENTVKRGQISATVSGELKEALEEYRWSARMTLSALIESILVEWASENLDNPELELD